MKLAHLKTIRVVISILFFVFTGLLFIDFSSLFSKQWIQSILYLQFVPSLIKFIHLLGFASLGFFIMIILSFLFGRIYCSSICPLGTLQDIISFFHKKVRKKKFKYIRTYNWLRYSILVITILFFISGSLWMLNLLDPFSNFGKIFYSLVKPVYIGLNNLLVNGLEKFDNYSLRPQEIKNWNPGAFIFSVVFLLMLSWFVIAHGRLYCNTLCPVGSLIGFLSRWSFYKLEIVHDSCTACGLCERVCKAECINSAEKTLDITRCISCYNCITVCRQHSISFRKHRFIKPELSVYQDNDKGRRNFIASLIILFGSFRLSKAQIGVVPAKSSSVPENRKYPVIPPGSQSIAHFTGTCTACHLCVSACPTQVIQPAMLEFGLAGFLQPRMDYLTSFCNYECVVCTEVCPSGAILPLTAENKKIVQLGVAKFIKENCVVYTENTDCGACSEHCPTKAVRMAPYIKGLTIPEITESICIGCGACEYACPTTPYKAIYIDGNPVHLTAQLPENEKEETVNTKEDFPF